MPPVIISPPIFTNFPRVFEKFTCSFTYFYVFRFPPTLTMMHLCITQCTYWTPLADQNTYTEVFQSYNLPVYTTPIFLLVNSWTNSATDEKLKKIHVFDPSVSGLFRPTLKNLGLGFFYLKTKNTRFLGFLFYSRNFC